ncbi:MAG: glucose-6-phosphate isomerase [Acidobacteriota bacterium]
MPGAHDLLSRWPALDVAARRDRLRDRLHVSPGTLTGAVATHRRSVDAAAAALWRRDRSLWSDDAAVQEKIGNRLGWLSSPALMADSLDRLRTFAAGVRRDGFRHVVLLGMGGSSLAPEVLRAVIGVAPGWPTLHMLDSTDPAAVRAAATPPEQTLYLLSSKSGTTIEPNSLAAHFRTRLEPAVPRWADHFVAITDEGTELARRAQAEGFRDVFINPSDIGGRYSALSYFGFVPAALMGQDLDGLAGWGLAMLAAAEPGPSAAVMADAVTNPAAALALIVGAAALAGRDKLTLVVPPALEAFGLWVEQLIAESTGKQGKGVVPIAGEAVGPAERYGDDRLFVRLNIRGAPAGQTGRDQALLEPAVEIELPEATALGAEFMRWEIATAILGAMFEINPFDEPNVQQAKDATHVLLDAYKTKGRLPDAAADLTLPAGARLVLSRAARTTLGAGSPAAILTLIEEGDYFALLAYLGPDEAMAGELRAFRQAVRDRTRAATMFGYGPRYLHSTGQLHKGGPNTGVFVLITAAPVEDLAIPGENFSFGTLELAQALGDFASLDATNRRALHIHLPAPEPALLREAIDALLKRAK